MAAMIKGDCGHFYDPEINDDCPYCDIVYVRNFRKTCIQPVSSLKNELDVVVQLDIAPDGRPRCLKVSRDKWLLDIENALSNFAGEGYSITRKQREIIQELEKSAKEYRLNNSLINFHGFNGLAYCSGLPLIKLLPPTLLAQILGRSSPLNRIHGNLQNSADDRTQTCANTASVFSNKDDFNVKRNEIDASRHLAISIDQGRCYSFAVDSSHTILDSVRPFEMESMRQLSPSYKVINQGEIIESGALDEEDNYSTALLAVANSTDYQRIKISVSRREIAKLFITIAKELQNIHARGFVHCDLKPQNILILSGTVMPIDSLNVPINEVSVGVTLDYCAPEQVLARPVSPATDVYNMGLMILQMINAQLFGGIKDHVIPTSRGKVTRTTLLESPDVYIESEKGVVRKEGIKSWRSFLQSCLSFDAAGRYPDMAAFSHEFSRLIEHFPPQGDIEFSPNFGTLGVFMDKAGCEFSGWMLEDDNSLTSAWHPAS